MKSFQKMTKRDFVGFCFMAIFSGLTIGVGGAASLLANSIFGTWGKIVGACLFSLGIYAIVTYGMKLFTGMVAEIPRMGFKNTWRLAVCFVCNILGVAVTTLLVLATPIGTTVAEQGKAVATAKLAAENWAWVALCSSILCGMLITLSVWSSKYAIKKDLSASVGVVFPIIVFAFCGFDHSVANTMYFYLLGTFSWQAVGYILICIVGNILGGVALPLALLVKEGGKPKE